jgi:hypothetical protein
VDFLTDDETLDYANYNITGCASFVNTIYESHQTLAQKETLPSVMLITWTAL